MCHVNLDARQSQIGLSFDIPVLYVTQLMAWAFGFNAKESGLNKKSWTRALRWDNVGEEQR